MNILIAYFSESGNTKMIAGALRESALEAGHSVVEKKITEINPDHLNDFDLVFLGSACHDADLAQPVKLLLNEVPPGPSFKLAGFVTHATTMPEGSERNKELFTRWAGKCEKTLKKASDQKGFELLGYFHCQGVPISPIAEFIHQEIIPDEEEWDDYINAVREHPNEEDLTQAKAFAQEVFKKVS
jgi:flavodoxin